MNQWDFDLFFTEALLERLRSSLSELEIIREYDRESLDWQKVLADTKAGILFTSWTTPFLPEGLPLEELSLKYVCHLPGSVRNRVPKKLIEQGLLVTNWGNSVSRTIAECGLMLILASLRKLPEFNDSMHREKAWNHTREDQFSLFERRVGLHGFGRISQDLAELLKPFTNKVKAYSPSVPDELLEKHGVKRANDLDSLFADSDIVVELAAMTERNRNIVKEKHLRMLPKNGVFVNIGRAGVVEEEALLKVAQEGHLRIGLDVYHKEPLPEDSPLRGLANVILLPHLAGPTIDRMQDSCLLAAENVERYCRGEDLEAQITAEQYDSMT